MEKKDDARTPWAGRGDVMWGEKRERERASESEVMRRGPGRTATRTFSSPNASALPLAYRPVHLLNGGQLEDSAVHCGIEAHVCIDDDGCALVWRRLLLLRPSRQLRHAQAVHVQAFVAEPRKKVGDAHVGGSGVVETSERR